MLRSKARDRIEYLRRPDLGQMLAEESARTLRAEAAAHQYDIALVIADGLSARAIQQNVLPFFELLFPPLKESGYVLAPVSLVKEGRVAVADEIGSILGAFNWSLSVSEKDPA